MANNTRNKYTRYKAHIGELIAAYPMLFNKAKPVPLAIGIQDQILNDSSTELSRTMIGDCLQVWTNRLEYHAIMRCKGAIRLNLNLTQAEPVSLKDQTHAARVHDAKRHKAKIAARAKNASKQPARTKDHGREVAPLDVENNNQDF